VIAELGVVRDVREVVEDLVARAIDRDGVRDGIHGGASLVGLPASSGVRAAALRPPVASA
jgi:hypothetical protein